MFYRSGDWCTCSNMDSKQVTQEAEKAIEAGRPVACKTISGLVSVGYTGQAQRLRHVLLSGQCVKMQRDGAVL